jgi:hypothetical protein
MAGGKDKEKKGLGIGEMQGRGWLPGWGVRDKSAMGGLLVAAFGQGGGVEKSEPVKRYSFPEPAIETPNEKEGDKPVQLGLGLWLEH